MNFTLRPVEDTDHEWLVELHNDPVVLHNMTHPDPITLTSHMKWWKEISKSKSQERLIFCVDGTRAGFTKFYNIDKTNMNCVLGADLHKDFRGRGLAVPMWNLMLDRCFKHHALKRVSLTTAEYNEVAVRVYTKIGFKHEGKLIKSLYRDGKWFDQHAMYLLAEDYNETNLSDR